MKQRQTIRLPAAEAPLPCPEWLGPVAKSKWSEVLRAMQESNVIMQSVDSDFLAMYCQAFQDLSDAIYELEEHGYTVMADSGAEYPSPAVARKNKAIDNIRRFGIELNLSPKRRAKPKSQPLAPPRRLKPA